MEESNLVEFINGELGAFVDCHHDGSEQSEEATGKAGEVEAGEVERGWVGRNSLDLLHAGQHVCLPR